MRKLTSKGLSPVLLIGILCLFSFLPGCNKDLKTEKITWNEEVKLLNSRAVTVERGVTLSSAVPREIGQGPREIEYTLAFLIPSSTTRVTWANPGKLVPLILDFEHDIPYLATIPHLMFDYDEYGCPNPGYVFFKYQNDWQRIEYRDFPKQFTQGNLLFDLKSNIPEIRVGTISADKVSVLNRPAGSKPPTINPNLGSPSNCGKTQIIK